MGAPPRAVTTERSGRAAGVAAQRGFRTCPFCGMRYDVVVFVGDYANLLHHQFLVIIILSPTYVCHSLRPEILVNPW